MALTYEDYSTAEHFSFDKSETGVIKTYEDYGLSAEENGSKGYAVSPVTVYQEDIYVGYRYFDSFQKSVAYPFGFGLSYADFEMQCMNAYIEQESLLLEVSVKNISGEYAGKEVVQVYISQPSVRLEQPAKQLKAFVKTKTLQPGEVETVKMCIPIKEMASFDEQSCAYILEPGIYGILIGNSVANVSLVAEIQMPREQTMQRVWADIGVAEVNRGKLKLLSCKKATAHSDNSKENGGQGRVFRLVFDEDITEITCPKMKKYDFSVEAKQSTLEQVQEGMVTMEEFLNQMTVEELAVLCNGYGPGLPFGGIGQNLPPTIYYDDGTPIGTNSHPAASPGYENPALTKYGIFSTWYKDGPASVGRTAWPTGMMLACSFNERLLYEFGHACGEEAEAQGETAGLHRD